MEVALLWQSIKPYNTTIEKQQRKQCAAPVRNGAGFVTGIIFVSGAVMPQPIETVEEFEQATQQIDLSDHEPIVVEIDEQDAMEAFDENH